MSEDYAFFHSFAILFVFFNFRIIIKLSYNDYFCNAKYLINVTAECFLEFLRPL